MSFEKRVQEQMQRIRDEKLYIDVEKWGTSCKNYRKLAKFKENEVARILRVNHKLINDQEKKDKKTNVNLFYLEAFSFIYHIMPENLLDTKHPPKQFLVYTADPQLERYQHIILHELYDPHEPVKIKYLQWINLIMSMTRDTRTKFFHKLESHKMHEMLFSGDIDSYSTMTECPNNITTLEYKNRFTWKYACAYTLKEAILLTDKMIFDNDLDLRKIAVLSIAGEEALACLFDVMDEMKIIEGHNTINMQTMQGYVLEAPKDEQADIWPQIFPNWIKMLRKT